jgi:hypothetical protein
MDLAQQKELINLYKRYQDTDRNTIKANLKAYTDIAELKPFDIAEYTRIPIQTIYQMRKLGSTYKPDFITALIICDMLELSITAILKPLTSEIKLKESEPTKWNQEVKQEFITDYNSMGIEDICKKYDITARTAQEYNKNFMRELGN